MDGSKRKRRLAIAGVLMLILAVIAAGIAQAKGGIGGAKSSAVATGVASVGSVPAAPVAADATVDDASIVALGLTALAEAGDLGISDQPDAAAPAQRLRDRLRWIRPHPGKGLGRLVHAEATLDLPDKGITTVGADHGTVDSLGTNTIAVKRADGQTVTIATTDQTRVRSGRKAAKLSDIKAGHEVLVLSQKSAAGWAAKRIIVIPKSNGAASGA
jgi:hypothetical protein